MELTSEPSSCSCLCGQRFPPGFRFQPTDEELVVYYLKRKICRQPIMRDVIGETDVYKREPEELPELSKLKTGDRQWFFFSPRDRKYPNGARSNRATNQGFWKVTGRDRIITYNSRNVGVKKTLVFYIGRTPTIKPKRTDWVMYEYTMDEEELKRCPSAQDYCALYRIFKKSGIGPKNGEQYGAPFREEDWADDDCLTVNPLVEQEKYTNQVNDVVNVESPIPNDFEIPSVSFEELLNLLEDEPYTVEPLVSREDTESTLLDHSSQNPNLPAQNAILHPTSPHSVQANFDVTQCSTSQPQLPEAPEFTSAPVYHGLNPQMVEEDFLEDFLEVDDLTGPEPSINNFNKPGEIMEIQQYGYDMGTREARHPNQPYANNAENGMVNPVSTYFSDNHETMNSQQLYFNEDNEGSNRLWSPDQRCNIVTPAEANHEVIHPATLGVVYDSHSLNDHPKGTNSNQITREDGATNSRFSSALWGSLESIPATPASAAESPADMAFEQTSRRSRVIARNMNNASGNTSRRSCKSISGFLCVFILGVLCAMLWILLGTPSLRYGGVPS